jgi:hypothetical protein
MLSCNEVTRELSRSQEERLGLKERMALRLHLSMCSGCRNFRKQLDVLRSAMRTFAAGKNERGQGR